MIIYLYRCWDAQNQLLYADITEDVDLRIATHRRTDYWWPDVNQVTRVAFQTRLEAEWAEWAVITTGHPLYNQLILPPRMSAEIGGEPNGADTTPVERDKVGARYAEHILAVTAAYPRWWITGIPSVRKTKAAIRCGRVDRGATYNSMSTTQRVLAEMKRISASPDPQEIIDRLRRPELARTPS